MTTTVVVWVEHRCVLSFSGKHKHVTWVQHTKIKRG